MRIKPENDSELQHELADAQQQLDIIKMVADELIHELDLDKLLTQVASRAQQLIKAETLLIPILDSRRNNYTYKAAVGKNASLILNQSFPVSAGMCGWVLSNRKPLVLAKDIPWIMDNKTTWEEGMESALLIPLLARGEIVGGLSAMGKENADCFTVEDYELLQLFATHVSIAIDNAKIFQELSEEKERTEITLQSIGDAVIETDAQGVIVRANPVACHFLAWSAEELMGRALTDVFKIYNADTRQVVDDPVEKVIRSGQVVGLANHTVLIDRYGQEYQIADSAAPIRDANNELLGVVLVFHDVTEEYKLLTVLRESEQKHRRLIEHLGKEYYMFIQGPDGKVNYVSPSVTDCLGYEAQEFVENYTDFLTDNDINGNIEKNFMACLNGENPEPYEIEVRNKQLELSRLRVTATPVFDDNGQLLVIEGLVQNITKQRELEHSVRQSQKMEAVGQLSGGIAHDFNNQLGVVMGYLEMLKENAQPGSSESRWIEIASKSSQRCIDLTRSLLNFSRKKNIKSSVVNLNKSLVTMQGLIEHSISVAIELSLSYDDDLWEVKIDEDEFQDVVLNLIINARDAMPAGGVLSLLTENVSLQHQQSFYINHLPAGDYVKLSVIDSGMGMNKQTLERIFEPFFTTKEFEQGTGLGMPMVFGFIDRIDGAIDALSAEGIGTRIDLYMPRVKSAVVKSSDTDVSASLPQGNEHILLVEDEPALRLLAEENLTDLGYQVYSAENGKQAIDLLHSEIKIDLLFSDVVMPGGIDGYDVAEQAKNLRPSIRVLLATGYSSFTDTQQFAPDSLTTNREVILYKPYSRSILAQRVRRVLDNE